METLNGHKANGNGKAVIETHGLTKYYGHQRGVIDLDLSVEEGEVFGYLGPNGAGKTTTIRLLMDLIRPTRGEMRVFGVDVQANSLEIKQQTGYLPGEMALWPNLTGWQTLTYLGNLRGGVPASRIEELASRLGLDLTRKFREYSKGNKQKVALIQAFMHNPQLLILDEPTASLDPLNQQEFFRMADEARSRGATIFLSSHVLSEVEHSCDRVGLIREGTLVKVGKVSEIVAEKHSHVAVELGVPAVEVAPAFEALPEVTELAVDGDTLSFVVHGSLDPVVKLAAQFPVVGLSSHEPTLEETFLSYYSEGEAPQPPEAPTAPKEEMAGVH